MTERPHTFADFLVLAVALAGKVACRCGLHKFGMWQRVGHYLYPFFERRCDRCKKVQCK